MKIKKGQFRARVGKNIIIDRVSVYDGSHRWSVMGVENKNYKKFKNKVWVISIYSYFEDGYLYFNKSDKAYVIEIDAYKKIYL